MQTASAGELLKLEHAHDRTKSFSHLDSLSGRVAIGALRGERPFSVQELDETGTWGRIATLHLRDLSDEERSVLQELFSLEKQKSRGNWSLPETLPARLGRLHF